MRADLVVGDGAHQMHRGGTLITGTLAAWRALHIGGKPAAARGLHVPLGPDERDWPGRAAGKTSPTDPSAAQCQSIVGWDMAELELHFRLRL